MIRNLIIHSFKLFLYSCAIAFMVVASTSCYKEVDWNDTTNQLSSELSEIVFDATLGSEAETKCYVDDNINIPELVVRPRNGYGTIRPLKEAGHIANINCESLAFEDIEGKWERIQTKTSEVSSLSSWNVICVNGSAGSEGHVWSVNGCTGGTGHFWPANNPGYKFYAANTSLYYDSGGCYVYATNDTDVVVAYNSSPSYNAGNTLSFQHIFGRIGTVTVVPAEGFSNEDITNISITITPQIYGYYNIRTGGWWSVSTGEATAIANSSPGTKSNGLYLVPGQYAVSGTFNSKGKAFEGSGYITVYAGQQTNLTFTLGGKMDLLPGIFTYSGKSISFSTGNLQATIATNTTTGSGNNTFTYCTASDWNIADSQYEFKNIFDPSVGSIMDQFAWVEKSATVDSYGLVYAWRVNKNYHGNDSQRSSSLKTSWVNIPIVREKYGPGWALPDLDFMEKYCGKSYNGTSRGIASSANIAGINGKIVLPTDFVLPSNCTYVPASESFTSVTYTLGAHGTPNAWCDMEDAGAVFFPAGGHLYYDSSNGYNRIYRYVGEYGFFHTAKTTNNKVTSSYTLYAGQLWFADSFGLTSSSSSELNYTAHVRFVKVQGSNGEFGFYFINAPESIPYGSSTVYLYSSETLSTSNFTSNNTRVTISSVRTVTGGVNNVPEGANYSLTLNNKVTSSSEVTITGTTPLSASDYFTTLALR